MERLVGEILAISKMEMDGLAWREPVSLGELVSQVTEALLPLAQERRITVHTQRSGEAVVSGSPSLLEKAIHNIVGNAIRHSPEGAQVTVQLTPTALTVTNTGVSIPQEDLPVLFTPFTGWRNPGTSPPAAAAWGCTWSRPSSSCTAFPTAWKTWREGWPLQWGLKSAFPLPRGKPKQNKAQAKNKPSFCMMEASQKGRVFLWVFAGGPPCTWPAKRGNPCCCFWCSSPCLPCCCCAFPWWRAPARPPGSCVPAWALPLPSGPTPR